MYSNAWAVYKGISELGYKHWLIIQDCDFGLTLKNELSYQAYMGQNMSQYLVRYLLISSTENKQLLHKFFIEVANLHPLLSDWECQVHSKEELGCGDDMEEPQPGSTVSPLFFFFCQVQVCSLCGKIEY